jgi:hypothetical protein
MQTVTRSSWKLLPLPVRQDRLELDLRYSLNDAERIKLGYMPKEMEDKWFLFFERNWLYFHRSWTGAGIYGVRFESFPDGFHVAEAWVNGDGDHYVSPGPEQDADMIQRLIERLLLS